MLVINEVKEGIWREYAPGVSAKLRPVPRSTYRELERKYTRQEETFVNGRRARTSQVDQDALDRALFEIMIEDWEGFVTPAKEPIKCTSEMIAFVTDRVPDFANWVVAECGSLEGRIAEEEDRELKNFSASHDGTADGQT